MSFLERLPQIHKGFVIEPDQVCELLGIRPIDADFEPSGFPLALTLAGMLEKELHATGRKWTCKAKDGRVYILTDPEAMRFNQKRQRAGERKFRRSLEGFSGVDGRKLTDDERQELDMSHRMAAAQVLAIKQARKSVMNMDLGGMAAGR